MIVHSEEFKHKRTSLTYLKLNSRGATLSVGDQEHLIYTITDIEKSNINSENATKSCVGVSHRVLSGKGNGSRDFVGIVCP